MLNRILAGAVGAFLLVATLAGCASSSTGSAFNGKNLDGWRGTAPWFVYDGTILCPNSTDLEAPLASMHTIEGPCEVDVELKLLRRDNEDGRGFWLKRDVKDQDAGELHVRIDSSPNEFQVKILPSGPTKAATHPLEQGEWYQLSCRVDADGLVTAKLDGETVITTQWPYGFPLTLGLECQRSGAAFRRVDVRDLN